MKKSVLYPLMAAPFLAAGAALAQSPKPAPDPKPVVFSVTSTSIHDGMPIDSKYAYCAYDLVNHTKDGGNISPELSWSGAPTDTKSYAIVVVDPDVPTVFDDANKDGKTIAADMPRKNFFHWILTDIPASVTSLPEGKDSQKVISGGKPVGKNDHGTTVANDYSKFYKGAYGGYDGPCPPWNDERMHHYHFIVYALDVPNLALPATGGEDAQKAIAAHALAKAEIVGVYTQNPHFSK